VSQWEEYLSEHREQFIEELMAFLRIPSISSLAEHAPDVQKSAEWVEGRMRAAGIESVQIMPTGGHPVVYGDWLKAPGKPTVLIYGHFDVQPVDPIDLWENPPFEPIRKEERIYARGATDDKGNMLAPVIATEALLKTTGALPVNVKFLFEGQEEIGSPQLPQFIKSKAGLLASDLVLSADGGQWAEDQPALVLGTRGLIAIQIDVQGPDHDLHSGSYGGTIANPIHALVEILHSMHDQDGRITIDGFYDDVRPLADEEREQLACVPFNQTEYLQQTGAGLLYGEPGFTTHERAWARPTVEVNGVYGGFQGEGVKTVLPSTAHAKVSCRLVADQEPSKVIDLVLAHIKKVAPPAVKVKAEKAETGAIPYLVPAEHPGMRIASAILKDLYGQDPYHIRMGGTIPANALFLEHLGIYTVVFSFGLEDERQHSPNEFFRLESFDRAQKAYAMILEGLGAEFRVS
jgi:acetylornithine deacetylase/succinyl-diaminopimelate desuccinylase-like protein